MDDLLDAIRAGALPDATPESRATAAVACRSILAALGEAPAVAPAQTTTPDIAGMVAALRGVPPDQLLELAISRLRAALPAGTSLPAAQPVKFHIVPIPPRG